MDTTSRVYSTWQAWADSWDRQQELYLVDRERRFTIMLDIVEAVAGLASRLLDLACGPGSISQRFLRRFPNGESVGVDVGPAMLAIAHGVLGADRRVRLVRADLTRPGWSIMLPNGTYDAVLTSTALHWLSADALHRLYADIAEHVLRTGGIFCNADHAPEQMAPTLEAKITTWLQDRREHLRAQGALTWEDWWKLAAADRTLADLVAERNAHFARSLSVAFTPPAE